MKLTVKRFNVEMEVKNTGIEFEVRTPNGAEHLGDIVITKTRLIWCPGKTTPKNGKAILLEELIAFMNAR